MDDVPIWQANIKVSPFQLILFSVFSKSMMYEVFWEVVFQMTETFPNFEEGGVREALTSIKALINAGLHLSKISIACIIYAKIH